MTRAAVFLAAALVAILPRVAVRAASPEAKCQAAKNRASGAYARLRLRLRAAAGAERQRRMPRITRSIAL